MDRNNPPLQNSVAVFLDIIVFAELTVLYNDDPIDFLILSFLAHQFVNPLVSFVDLRCFSRTSLQVRLVTHMTFQALDSHLRIVHTPFG